MELEQFKKNWQQQTQEELSRFRHTPEQISVILADMETKIRKVKKQNKFWLAMIIIGLIVCIGGFLNFHFHYTPEKFPTVNIQLYDALFLFGIFIVIGKLVLSYVFTLEYYFFSQQLYESTVKSSLENMYKRFEQLYRFSLWGTVILLPPFLFFEIRFLSRLLDWQIHHQPILNSIYAGVWAFIFIGIGHYYYKKMFNKHISQLKEMLLQLENNNS